MVTARHQVSPAMRGEIEVGWKRQSGRDGYKVLFYSSYLDLMQY